MNDITDILKNYDRCRICIEEECGGKRNCHCSTCENVTKCPKMISATIRITNKCTQKCSHCCFNSNPDSKIMMSVDMAKTIAEFIKNNNIFRLNLMGGEFFCNPDWYEIFDLFIEAAPLVRIVSNSDWAHNEDVKSKLKKLKDKYDDRFHISLSKDKWHTNKNVDAADEYLKEIGVIHNVTKDGEMTDESIVPVGRGELESYNIYSTFNAYCLNPETRYGMLIDELGNIYKCSFGTWKYATVDEYVDGGFEEKFKDFHQKCRKIFISNCRRCRMSAEMCSGTDEVNGEEIVVKCK